MGQSSGQKAAEAIGSVLFNLPQTQMQISKITQAGEQQLTKIGSQVETYAYAQLGLQTVTTVAVFGMFLIALYNFVEKKNQKGGSPQNGRILIG